MIRVPMRNHERTQFLDRNLQDIEVAGKRGRRQCVVGAPRDESLDASGRGALVDVGYLSPGSREARGRVVPALRSGTS
jgi:hypothetical protein